MNLYSFANFSTPDPQLRGAPRLVPTGVTGPGGQFIQQDSFSLSLIDVIENFHWTTTKKEGRQAVPCIYLREKRLRTNALVAQSIYYGLAVSSIAGGGVAGLGNLPTPVRQIVGGAIGNRIFTALQSTGVFNAIGNIFNIGSNIATNIFGIAGFVGGSLLGGIGSGIGGLIGGIGQGIRSPVIPPIAGTIIGATDPTYLPKAGLNIASNLLGYIRQNTDISRFNVQTLGSNYLEPYEGLYLTEDTGFFYKFPYFQNRQNSVTNNFKDKDEAFGGSDVRPGGYIASIGEIAEEVRRVATGTAALLNIGAPGVYIERPKFYSFGEPGDDITFNFPLINTGWANFNDVVANWQLLFLLIYQNRPNRRSRDLIDPPVMYEVSIPGIKYHPYAYIEKLEVNFRGARRKMNITVPVLGGNTVINTIIPDAYDVTIVIRTLVRESQNFLYAMLSDKQNIITTAPATFNPLDLIQTAITTSFDEVQYSGGSPFFDERSGTYITPTRPNLPAGSAPNSTSPSLNVGIPTLSRELQ